MSTAAKPLPEAALRSVLEPDLNHETFVFGKNPDGSARTWSFAPLPWRFEKHFRRQVMPMLAATYKPFETIISLLGQDILTDYSPSLTKAMFDAETEADEFLPKAVHAILVAQDKAITEEWVNIEAESREQLFSIVQRQCEIHRIMDRLGESLAERFGKLAQMVGVDVDLPTLKRLWKQASEKLSARIMKVGSTVDSAIGLSLDSSSETTSPRSGEETAGLASQQV
jgi:hypothetical protein